MVINEEIEEVEISAQGEIFDFISDIELQKLELVLTKNGTTVGAVLTAEQYAWFLDQLDAQQDLSFINERINDREGSQDFESFKRDIK